MKKLTQLGIPTKNGGRWSESTVGSILRNEKMVGDMRLQKGFVVDHITKRHKKNEGELEQFYVEDNHAPIIDRTTFEAVQIEMARRAAVMKPRKEKAVTEFSGLIRCGRCGAKFIRKINGSGTKYAKVTWACRTYTYRGKQECPAKRIPDDILRAKCAEALGIPQYKPEILTAKIEAITIPDDGILEFAFKDGIRRRVAWENPSRAESWSNEMKQTVSKKMKEAYQNGNR